MFDPSNIPIVSSWDSVFSLVLSIISILMIKNVKTSIVLFRRKQRLKDLVEEVKRIPDDAIPLGTAPLKKIEALGRNIETKWYLFFDKGNRSAKELKKIISGITNAASEEKMAELKEAIADWASFSEDL